MARLMWVGLGIRLQPFGSLLVFSIFSFALAAARSRDRCG
jgi:hypothetical protein